MMSKNDYPGLGNFIACSFHQDWEETADTYTAVVDINLRRETASHLQRVAAEIEALLASPVQDEELGGWLDAIGCEAIVEGEGYTPRSFVGMIGERIRAKQS